MQQGNVSTIKKSLIVRLFSYYRHTMKRARQRFGINLSEHEYFDLIAQIESKEAMFVCERPGFRELWAVKYIQDAKVHWLYAIYNPRDMIIVTVLTEDMV